MMPPNNIPRKQMDDYEDDERDYDEDEEEEDDDRPRKRRKVAANPFIDVEDGISDNEREEAEDGFIDHSDDISRGGPLGPRSGADLRLSERQKKSQDYLNRLAYTGFDDEDDEAEDGFIDHTDDSRPSIGGPRAYGEFSDLNPQPSNGMTRDNDEPPTKRIKLNPPIVHTQVLQEPNLFQHHIFTYLNPKDYLSCLLTCSQLNYCLFMNECFQYCRLLKTGMIDVQYLPSLHFFTSQIAKNIQHIIHYRIVWDGYRQPITICGSDLVDVDESRGIEILKLHLFDVDEKNGPSWFIPIQQDLQKIWSDHDSPCFEQAKLINQYYHFIPTAFDDDYRMFELWLRTYHLYNCPITGSKISVYSREAMVYVLQCVARDVYSPDYNWNEGLVYMEYLSDELRYDKEVVLLALAAGYDEAKYVPQCLLYDKEIAIAAVSKRNSLIMNDEYEENEVFDLLPDEMKKDPDVVIAAFSISDSVEEWPHVSDYQNSKEFMLRLVKNNYTTFRYASDELKNDEVFVRECITINSRVLEYTPAKFNSNREIFEQLIVKDGYAISYASSDLKDDKELILLSKGYSFKFASEKIRGDKDLILSLLNMKDEETYTNFQYNILDYICGSAKSDPDIWRIILSEFGPWLNVAGDNIKSDRDMVILAMNNDPIYLVSASTDLQKDKQLALKLVSSGYVRCVHQDLCSDKDFILEAIDALKQSGISDSAKNVQILLKKVPTEIWQDDNFVNNVIFLTDIYPSLQSFISLRYNRRRGMFEDDAPKLFLSSPLPWPE